MERKIIARLSIQRKLWHRISSPFAGLVLAISLAISVIAPLEANASDQLPTHKQVNVTDDGRASAETTAPHSVFPADGTYLYGQSPNANQIGVAYAIFEVRDRTAVGAFYMPQSSFDCFYGEVVSHQMNLTIVNSYEQEAYAYSLPLSQQATVASSDGIEVSSPAIEGYFPIDTVSEVDREMLSTCRANYSKNI